MVSIRSLAYGHLFTVDGILLLPSKLFVPTGLTYSWEWRLLCWFKPGKANHWPLACCRHSNQRRAIDNVGPHPRVVCRGRLLDSLLLCVHRADIPCMKRVFGGSESMWMGEYVWQKRKCLYVHAEFSSWFKGVSVFPWKCLPWSVYACYQTTNMLKGVKAVSYHLT